MIPRTESEEPSWASHSSFSEIISAIWHPAHDRAFPLADRGRFSHSALYSLSLIDKGKGATITSPDRRVVSLPEMTC